MLSLSLSLSLAFSLSLSVSISLVFSWSLSSFLSFSLARLLSPCRYCCWHCHGRSCCHFHCWFTVGVIAILLLQWLSILLQYSVIGVILQLYYFCCIFMGIVYLFCGHYCCIVIAIIVVIVSFSGSLSFSLLCYMSLSYRLFVLILILYY